MASTDLAGKIIVVLGASSGYGLAAACGLLARGATVVMGMRSAEGTERVVGRQETGKAITVELDVREPSEIEDLVRNTIADFGRIDVWVNSASIGIAGHFESIPLADHREVIETDLIGTLNASYLAVAQFRTQASGGILINVAADPESLDLAYMVSYCAAKRGVVGLTAALRAEAKSQEWKNIHVCTVMPGDLISPTREQLDARGSAVTPPVAQTAVLDKVADSIVDLVTSPRDEVRVTGTHYFL
jgi:NAD(P)-dependent dehydrogenase (short-subunit alcohol dehydrogenase family)